MHLTTYEIAKIVIDTLLFGLLFLAFIAAVVLAFAAHWADAQARKADTQARLEDMAWERQAGLARLDPPTEVIQTVDQDGHEVWVPEIELTEADIQVLA